MVVPKFFIKQRITVMVNRYEIRAANPDGTEGQLMAFAEQKRMKLKEEVIFFADESKSAGGVLVQGPPAARRPRRARRARRERPPARLLQQAVRRQPAALDLEPVGAGDQGRRPGTPPFIAILRRIWDFIPFIGDVWIPFVFHFDFVDTATGQVVMISERQKAIRDRYEVTVPDPRLDFRVAACHGRRPGRAAEPLTSGHSGALSAPPPTRNGSVTPA